jgi:ribosomal protein S12 methylthiotransferase accessory factor
VPQLAPGPPDPPRALAPEAFLRIAQVAARQCGVTRLADITGLDRVGLPVWQAVRPEGRALSVHQGKGASPLTAKMGALCEAIESHRAEHVRADGPVAAFADLPPEQRAPDFSDYCVDRTKLPDQEASIPWCEAVDLLTGAPHYLPHELVSLDFRSGLPNRIERVSGGTGAGATEQDAVRVALLELIERDALSAWQQLGQGEQAATSLNLEAVPFDWFQAWRERLRTLRIELEAFQLKAIVNVPAFMCVIGGTEEFGSAYRRFSGAAAHPDAEQALFKALAEALQSRLTLIAGVRDDILPSYYERHSTSRKSPHWPPPGTRTWAQGDSSQDVPGWAEELARQGYRQFAIKRLDRDLDGIAVVKAFVPGLGSLTRTRRPAA